MERTDDFIDLRFGVAGGDEFWAVPVVGEDFDTEDPLGFGAVSALGFEFLGEVGVFVGIKDGGVAKHFQASAAGVVDEEEGDAVAFCEAAGADELAVPTVVDEGDLLGPDGRGVGRKASRSR